MAVYFLMETEEGPVLIVKNSVEEYIRNVQITNLSEITPADTKAVRRSQILGFMASSASTFEEARLHGENTGNAMFEMAKTLHERSTAGNDGTRLLELLRKIRVCLNANKWEGNWPGRYPGLEWYFASGVEMAFVERMTKM